MKTLTDRIDTIEEEYSSKLNEIEKNCQKIMTKSGKKKLKKIWSRKQIWALTQANK